MKILILEENTHIMALIESIAKQQLSNINSIFKGFGVSSCLSLINQNKFDLIITSLILEDAYGNEVLKKLAPLSSYVICISNNSRFASEAIKFNFVKDYLIKPLNIEDLRCALNRYKNTLKNYAFNELANYQLENNLQNKKITYTTNQKTEYINLTNIVRVEAMRSYCKVVLSNKRTLVYSKPLSSLIKQFPQSTFYRVHKSHLINLNYIETLNKNGTISLKTDEDSIPLSRERKKELLSLLEVFV
jgi:two-component system LytT family response regulator